MPQVILATLEQMVYQEHLDIVVQVSLDGQAIQEYLDGVVCLDIVDLVV